MSWGEALRLTALLLDDPSSMVTARLSGWDHPVSREAVVMMDLFDLTHLANTDSKKRSQVKPYRRPWPSEGTKRRGRTRMSRAEVVAVLNQHGHSLTA